ncbi:MAG: GNAT family N-acetyltransferase [Thermoleophilia bacterium]|nr:GNAT family N-acetyltransferase [Thermoleophilia bacterium]
MSTTIPRIHRDTAAPLEATVVAITPTLAVEWERLVARCGAPSFLGPGYLDVWRAAFGDGEPVRVVAARRDGRLVGVLPVGGRTVAGPPGNAETPVQDIVAETGGDAARVADALMGLGRPVAQFRCLPADSAGFAAASGAAARARREWRTRPAVRIPVVDTDQGWDAYWASCSRNLKHNVRRCTRRAEERGALELVLHDAFAPGELEPLLEAGFAVEGSGWKGDEGTALAVDPVTGGYYRRLARWAADRGELRLFFVRNDGRDIAFALCVHTAGTLYALKIGYRDDMSKLSPGVLLLHGLIRWTFDEGLRRFDFAGHDAPYKSTWATAHQEQLEASAFTRGPVGLAVRLARAARAEAGRRLRRA